MSDLRKSFEEKLSERVKIILIDCDFNDFENRYCYCDFERKDDFNLGVINGAWYMFFEDHEKQQAIIDSLKAQLNNMEACYIEKKKEVEGLQERFNFLLDKNIRNESEHASLKIRVTHVSHLMDKAAESGTECVDIGCLYDALIKGGDLDEVLRGAND